MTTATLTPERRQQKREAYNRWRQRQRDGGATTRFKESSHPSWAIRTRPLLAYLASPRSWPALLGWAPDHDMAIDTIRQCLAWLEGNGLATTTGEGLRLRWVRT